MPAGQTIVDGSVAFSGGVDSIKATTVASENNPQGLLRSQLSWLNNAGVRDGGILQRTGFDYKGRIHDGSALFQGGCMYEPSAAYPYLVLSIGGHIYQVDVDSPDTNVDFEHGLTTAVNRLRDLLGDSAHEHRLIETIPFRGYRCWGA